MADPLSDFTGTEGTEELSSDPVFSKLAAATQVQAMNSATQTIGNHYRKADKPQYKADNLTPIGLPA